MLRQPKLTDPIGLKNAVLLYVKISSFKMLCVGAVKEKELMDMFNSVVVIGDGEWVEVEEGMGG